MQSPGPLRVIVYEPAGMTVGGPLVVPSGVPSGSVTVTCPEAVKVTMIESACAFGAACAAPARSSASAAAAAQAARQGRVTRDPVTSTPEAYLG